MKPINQKSNRVALMDELRGLAVILMVAYHAAYDLHYFFETPISPLQWPVMRVLQPFFAGVFIVLSGMASRFSRNNIKRGLIALALGGVMTVVTLWLALDQPIYFGILHLLGSSMLLYALLHKQLDLIRPLPGAVLMLLLFALTYRIPAGALGLPPFALPLPGALTATNWLAPLGFIRPDFRSPDYYPLIPWSFLFFAGAYLGLPVWQGEAPGWVYAPRFGWLAAVGRQSLAVYLLHQPVLYGIFWLWFRFVG